jgi:hypothetical protein
LDSHESYLVMQCNRIFALYSSTSSLVLYFCGSDPSGPFVTVSFDLQQR